MCYHRRTIIASTKLTCYPSLSKAQLNMNKEFKIVLAGDFGSGRTTYLNQFVAAKRGKSKVGA